MPACSVQGCRLHFESCIRLYITSLHWLGGAPARRRCTYGGLGLLYRMLALLEHETTQSCLLRARRSFSFLGFCLFAAAFTSLDQSELLPQGLCLLAATCKARPAPAPAG